MALDHQLPALCLECPSVSFGRPGHDGALHPHLYADVRKYPFAGCCMGLSLYLVMNVKTFGDREAAADEMLVLAMTSHNHEE